MCINIITITFILSCYVIAVKFNGNMYTRTATITKRRARNKNTHTHTPALNVKHFNYVMIIFQYIFFFILRKAAPWNIIISLLKRHIGKKKKFPVGCFLLVFKRSSCSTRSICMRLLQFNQPTVAVVILYTLYNMTAVLSVPVFWWFRLVADGPNRIICGSFMAK